MKMQLSRALCATTALATGLLIAGSAMAQSTGTSVVEELVVTGATGPRSLEGTIVAEREPKSRASITQEFITTQVPGQTVLDTINLLPAVNFTNNDAFGSAGGDVTLRGIDSQRIALLQDGVPLNDSGNYAIYPNQQLDSDLIERVTVNLGTTDVDSPTAAAAGGTINYITRKASNDFGVRAEVGVGTTDFQRYYGTLETGRIGPFGTKAWISGLFSRNDIFRPHRATIDPPGKIQKTQFNARIDQDFGDIGWASLILHYNENRNNFINRISLANYRAGVAPVYNATCALPAPVAGTAQNEACANFFGHNINPSNTGNIRGLSSWKVTDTLTLTVDPSFQYTLANGGGAQAWSERDAQIRGNSTAAGLDLNGDGDILDSVLLYRPNTTNTRRYGVTSSLIWKFADNQSFRVAYTYDKAKHRQTGDVGYLDDEGHPEDVFGGKDGHGRQVTLPDGTNLRRRDRASVASLNQFSAEYRGRFMDDRLLFNIGVRAPFFKRDLQNFCYQRDTFNAFCTTQTPFIVPGTNDGSGRPLVVFPGGAAPTGATLGGTASGSQILTGANLAAYRAFFNTTATNSPFYGQPRQFTRKYDDVLPNVGASYDINDNLTVYASYAETLSAPRTDDLYDRDDVDPGPENSKVMDLGFRYNSGGLLASGAIWRNQFSNRIERVFDEQAGIAFSENVGDVELWGIDFQAGYDVSEQLNVYGAVSYIESEIQDDIPGTAAGPALPTKGKSLYETPTWQTVFRATYKPTTDLSFGWQTKYVGSRWSNLVNTEKFPDYVLTDVDMRVKLDRFGLENTYIQANVRNLFDERYLGDMAVNLTGTGLAQPGYRRTFVITLHAEF